MLMSLFDTLLNFLSTVRVQIIMRMEKTKTRRKLKPKKMVKR